MIQGIFIVFVMGMLALGLAGFLQWRESRTASRIRRGLCPKCGYDLRGSDAGMCPECGNTLNRVTPATTAQGAASSAPAA
jgi:hypothetical protein